MGYAFPNSPILGQTANGYTWDGQKWTKDTGTGSDPTKLNVAGGQTTTGGFKFTAHNLGTLTGTVTPNAYAGNYKIGVNAGAFTLGAPADDCAIDLMVTNASGAGAITFSGYTAGSNTGDALTTTSGHKFIISIRRMNGISTYVIKALQ